MSWWPFGRWKHVPRKRHPRAVRGGPPERTDADIATRLANASAPSTSGPLYASERDRLRFEQAREEARLIAEAVRRSKVRAPEPVTDEKIQLVVDAMRPKVTQR